MFDGSERKKNVHMLARPQTHQNTPSICLLELGCRNAVLETLRGQKYLNFLALNTLANNGTYYILLTIFFCLFNKLWTCTARFCLVYWEKQFLSLNELVTSTLSPGQKLRETEAGFCLFEEDWWMKIDTISTIIRRCSDSMKEAGHKSRNLCALTQESFSGSYSLS